MARPGSPVPGQEVPQKIWQDAERLGEGYQWMLRSEITGGFVDAARTFLESAKKDGQPSYVNVWPDDVHSPFWPPTDRWAESKRDKYLAVLETMDQQLGCLFHYIKAVSYTHLTLPTKRIV